MSDVMTDRTDRFGSERATRVVPGVRSGGGPGPVANRGGGPAGRRPGRRRPGGGPGRRDQAPLAAGARAERGRGRGGRGTAPRPGGQGQGGLGHHRARPAGGRPPAPGGGDLREDRGLSQEPAGRHRRPRQGRATCWRRSPRRRSTPSSSRPARILLLTRANLARDQANSDLADTELQRSRRLLARQAAAQQEFETVLAKDRVADANVVATEANLQVNEADIHRLETLQSFQKVTAPFSGVITARNHRPRRPGHRRQHLDPRAVPPRPDGHAPRLRERPADVLDRRQGRPEGRRVPAGRPHADRSPARSRGRPTPWTPAPAPC